MTYKIIFSPRFTASLDNAFGYISNDLSSPIAAENLMSEIDKRISYTAENPYMYPLCPEPLSRLGYRKITVKNYIAVYLIKEEEKAVHFLDFIYGRQNYIDILK